VVQVETNRGQGSGVVYDDGLLLTNHHVIDGATEVRIRTASGRVVDVEVLGSDPRNDIAVLTAPRSRLPVAAIGSSAALEVGQLTVAIGSPFQLQQTVTAGIVSSVNRPVPNAAGGITAMIQTDAPINPGNSGGALANRDGDLVGINAAIRTDGVSNSNVGIGFAVPIDTAIEVADRIVAGESLDPGVLGVVGDRQDAGIGVPVADVIPDSGAAASGLQPGDRVLTVDGAPVTNVVELIGLIQSNFSGDTVELELNRNGAILTVEALLS
jgi:S1-C subfamily serine protease